MARVIRGVPEFYPDEVVDHGASFEVFWHARIVFEGEDPAGEWHYYGTTPGPEHPDAITHPATLFPTRLRDLSDSFIMFDLAMDAERNLLQM